MSGNGSFVPLKLVAECSRNHSVQTNLLGPGRQVMRLFVGALRALNHRENTPGKALEAPLQSWDGEYSDCDATGPVSGVISSDSSDWLILLAVFVLGVLLPALCIALA